MKIFNVINGLFALFVSLYCGFFSESYLVEAAWMVGILLLYLIISWIISFFFKHYLSKERMFKFSRYKITNFIFSICCFLTLLLANFTDVSYEVLQLLVFVDFSIWIIIDGIFLLSNNNKIPSRKKKETYSSHIVAIFELSLFAIIVVLYITGAIIANYAVAFIVALFGLRLIASVAFVDISKIEKYLNLD